MNFSNKAPQTDFGGGTDFAGNMLQRKQGLLDSELQGIRRPDPNEPPPINRGGGPPLTDVQGLTGPGARRGGVPPQMGSGGGNMAPGIGKPAPPPQMGSGGGNMSIPPQTGGALANKPGFDMGFKKPAPQGMMTGSFARPRALPTDNVAPKMTRPDDSGI